MGTNYYIRPKGTDCPNQDHWIHLGKSSAGWRFQFQAYQRGVYLAHDETPTWPVVDYETWLMLFNLGDVYDEYGDRINKQYMRDMIDRKKDQHYECSGGDYLDKNGHYFICGEFS